MDKKKLRNEIRPYYVLCDKVKGVVHLIDHILYLYHPVLGICCHFCRSNFYSGL